MPDIDEKLPNGMVITRIGRGHYNVRSETKEGISYTVDIFENSVPGQPPLGSCTCDDFLFNRLPKWKANGRIADSRYRCKHCACCRNSVLDKILMANQYRANEKKS